MNPLKLTFEFEYGIVSFSSGLVFYRDSFMLRKVLRDIPRDSTPFGIVARALNPPPKSEVDGRNYVVRRAIQERLS